MKLNANVATSKAAEGITPNPAIVGAVLSVASCRELEGAAMESVPMGVPIGFPMGVPNGDTEGASVELPVPVLIKSFTRIFTPSWCKPS
jgi:hypothetical protein